MIWIGRYHLLLVTWEPLPRQVFPHFPNHACSSHSLPPPIETSQTYLCAYWLASFLLEVPPFLKQAQERLQRFSLQVYLT